MSVSDISIARFRLGRLVATPNARERLTAGEITQALKRRSMCRHRLAGLTFARVPRRKECCARQQITQAD